MGTYASIDRIEGMFDLGHAKGILGSFDASFEKAPCTMVDVFPSTV